MKEGTKTLLIAFFIAICIITLSIYIVYKDTTYRNEATIICEEHNFEFYQPFTQTREGYIGCCNSIYEKNIKQEYNYCEGVKFE